MFALILALTFNPATHQTYYTVAVDGFQSEESCETYANSEAGQKYMENVGALSYTCDQLKGLR